MVVNLSSLRTSRVRTFFFLLFFTSDVFGRSVTSSVTFSFCSSSSSRSRASRVRLTLGSFLLIVILEALSALTFPAFVSLNMSHKRKDLPNFVPACKIKNNNDNNFLIIFNQQYVYYEIATPKLQVFNYKITVDQEVRLKNQYEKWHDKQDKKEL